MNIVSSNEPIDKIHMKSAKNIRYVESLTEKFVKVRVR